VFRDVLTVDDTRLVLRVQYLDAKSTLNRWEEEVELVKVEMNRTMNYFDWMAQFWRGRAQQAETCGEQAHSLSMRILFIGLRERIHEKVA
jgi:hypothetical protein